MLFKRDEVGERGVERRGRESEREGKRLGEARIRLIMIDSQIFEVLYWEASSFVLVKRKENKMRSLNKRE